MIGSHRTVPTAAGEFDTAFQMVETGLAQGAHWLTQVYSEDYFEALRKDPRWASLAPRVAPILAQIAREKLAAQTTK